MAEAASRAAVVGRMERAARALAPFGTAIAVVAATLVLWPRLGDIDLWAPDEPRYAQVAEELRRLPNGPADLVVLRLGGEVYTQKPPLYYWLAAAVGTTRGRVDELSARLPSAVAGVLVIVLAARLGRGLIGTRGAGALAAGILLTTPRFSNQARRAQLDVLLTLFELLALLAYWSIESSSRSDDGRPLPPRRGTLALLHGSVGLALLTKGPVGALPWLVIVIHRLWDGRGRSLRALFPAWGVALAIGPVLAWLAAVTALTPAGYFGDAVLDNVVARFFSGTDHVRPFTYYLTQLPVDALPWTPIAIVGAVLAWRHRFAAAPGGGSAMRLLLAWVAVFFIFFSLSAGKRGVYMLPALPALATLAAVALSHWIEAGQLPRTAAYGGAAILATVATASAWAGLGAPGWPDAAVLSAAPSAYFWSCTIVAFAGAATMIWIGRPLPAAGVVVFGSAVLLLEVALFQLLYPALDAEKSPRPIADAVARFTSTHDHVGVFRHGTFTGGLEYYSGRRAVALESARDVREFHMDGHRIIVVRERDYAVLDARAASEVRASARSGRRRLLVVELTTTAPASRTGDEEATPGRLGVSPRTPRRGDATESG